MLTIIEAELIYRPDGSFIKVPAAAYSARVRQLEAEGCDTSDAQGIADAEFLAADRLQNESPKQSPKRQTYTLAELRNGTGFRPGARFIEVQS
jgi:hypothetical protein